MKRRLNAIRSTLSDRSADALWITSLPDIRWACGFTGSNGVLIVRVNDAHFVSDGRYTTQARNEVEGAQVHVRGYDLVGCVAELGLLDDTRSALFQSDSLSVAALDRLTEQFPDTEWIGEEAVLSRFVASKDEDELQRIRLAQEITDDVFAHLLGWLRPGLTERDVAAEVVYQHLRRGAERMSFEPIVASGVNSALPHARPTDRRIEQGDVLLLDFGCFLDGYASDMTRTLAIGTVDPEARAVYDIVLDAQQRALEGARAGMSAHELDALARRAIAAHGYADQFSHGLGHGVGLQVHEWPRVTYSVDYDLPSNAVVSIEPGIYLSDRFGIRIEDLIVLREGCSEIITRAPKEWIEL